MTTKEHFDNEFDDKIETLAKTPAVTIDYVAITALFCLKTLIVEETKNRNTELCCKISEAIAKIIQASDHLT